MPGNPAGSRLLPRHVLPNAWDLDCFLDTCFLACSAQKAEVMALGGLHVIGTERHESRRIDNQLRGRTARQGDPGSTRFFLSLEDNIFRIFGGDRIQAMMSVRISSNSLPPVFPDYVEFSERKVEVSALSDLSDLSDLQRQTFLIVLMFLPREIFLIF